MAEVAAQTRIKKGRLRAAYRNPVFYMNSDLGRRPFDLLGVLAGHIPFFGIGW